MPAKKQVADRGVGDERVDDDGDRGRDDRADDCGRRGKCCGKARGVAAVRGHHDLRHLAGAGRVGDGRARHAGEDDRLHDVDMGEAAAEAPHQGVAEMEQALGHRAGVHQFGGEDEQGHGEQDVARVHAVQQLLGGGAHVEAGEPEIEDRAADHGMPDRQAENAQADNREDAEDEGIADVHRAGPGLSARDEAIPAQLACAVSASASHTRGRRGRVGGIGGAAAQRPPQDPRVADEDRNGEDHVDREEPVETDLRDRPSTGPP